MPKTLQPSKNTLTLSHQPLFYFLLLLLFLFCVFTDALYFYVFTQIFELEGLTLQVVGDYNSNCAAASQQGFTMVVLCALKAGLLAGWLTVFWGPECDHLLASQPISNATH